MNKIITIITLVLFSCTEPKYEYIGQEIIDGKVSAIQNSNPGGYGISATAPKIWVQNATNTKEVTIPFGYENRWKVGDSCLLIIEKYQIIDSDASLN